MEKKTQKGVARSSTKEDLSPGEKGFVYLRDHLPQTSYVTNRHEEGQKASISEPAMRKTSW